VPQKELLIVEELGVGVTSHRLASLPLGHPDPSGARGRDELGEASGSERTRSAQGDAGDLPPGGVDCRDTTARRE